jgi:hypothetical protein
MSQKFALQTDQEKVSVDLGSFGANQKSPIFLFQPLDPVFKPTTSCSCDSL